MSEEIWTPNTVTMPSGIEVQPLSDNDPQENTVLECLEKAKQGSYNTQLLGFAPNYDKTLN